MSVIIPENSIHKSSVKSPKGLGIATAYPAIIPLHTLHVLRIVDSDQGVDLLIRLLIEEVDEFRSRPAGNRLILLNKHIGARKGAQKSKALHVFLQCGIVPIHADELRIVPGAESKQIILPADQIQMSAVIQAEMDHPSGKLQIGAVDPPDQSGCLLIQKPDIQGLGEVHLDIAPNHLFQKLWGLGVGENIVI